VGQHVAVAAVGTTPDADAAGAVAVPTSWNSTKVDPAAKLAVPAGVGAGVVATIRLPPPVGP
jgi:hypothetical protein